MGRSFQGYLVGQALLLLLLSESQGEVPPAAPAAGGGSDHHYITQVAAGVAVTKFASPGAAENAIILVPVKKEHMLSAGGFCDPHCFLVCKGGGKYHLPPFIDTAMDCARFPLGFLGGAVGAIYNSGGRPHVCIRAVEAIPSRPQAEATL